MHLFVCESEERLHLFYVVTHDLMNTICSARYRLPLDLLGQARTVVVSRLVDNLICFLLHGSRRD